MGEFFRSHSLRIRTATGTGHELSLIAWLFCLESIGLLVPSDRTAVVLRVYHGYLALMQKLQTTYWLEPAGSHGVWGLDDYQFLCFVFGAAQLVNHPHILPSSIHDEELLEREADDYMYLGAIAFIRKVRVAKRAREAAAAPLFLQATLPYVPALRVCSMLASTHTRLGCRAGEEGPVRRAFAVPQ
jgi:hypothetical protein